MTCKFCAKDSNTVHGVGYRGVMHLEDGNVLIVHVDKDPWAEFEIGYCPVCGRPLEAEARE